MRKMDRDDRAERFYTTSFFIRVFSYRFQHSECRYVEINETSWWWINLWTCNLHSVHFAEWSMRRVDHEQGEGRAITCGNVRIDHGCWGIIMSDSFYRGNCVAADAVIGINNREQLYRKLMLEKNWAIGND